MKEISIKILSNEKMIKNSTWKVNKEMMKFINFTKYMKLKKLNI